MAEYIEREELIKKIELSINSWGRDCNSNAPAMVSAYQDVLHRVKNILTADVVEVVRCKDCEMSRETEDERYLFCMHFADTVGFRAFCSYGARKEGAEE